MTTRRLIGYVRVAPRERVSARPGLEQQRDAIRAECDRRGFEVVGFEQDIRSGRTLRRSGLTAAMEACRSGEADGIIVARLDRLTYSVEDLATLVADAVESGFGLVAPDVDLDLSSPEGRAVAAVLGAAAGWAPRSISIRGRRPASGEARPGRPFSTPADLAERIRGLRAGGATLQSICDRLNADGVPTARGGSHWRPSSLRAILRQPSGQ